MSKPARALALTAALFIACPGFARQRQPIPAPPPLQHAPDNAAPAGAKTGLQRWWPAVAGAMLVGSLIARHTRDASVAAPAQDKPDDIYIPHHFTPGTKGTELPPPPPSEPGVTVVVAPPPGERLQAHWRNLDAQYAAGLRRNCCCFGAARIGRWSPRWDEGDWVYMHETISTQEQDCNQACLVPARGWSGGYDGACSHEGTRGACAEAFKKDFDRRLAADKFRPSNAPRRREY